MESLIKNKAMDDEKLLMDKSVTDMLEENKNLFRKFVMENNEMNIVVNDGETIYIKQLASSLVNEVEKVYYIDDESASILLHNDKHLEIKIL